MQSSLTRFHSCALVYSTHPPESVSSTGGPGNTMRLFLADHLETRSGRSPSCQVIKVCFLLLRGSTWLNQNRCRNINLLSIACAVRHRLRSRLTLGRKSLPRKPWIYGGVGFHHPCRYLCLHPHFSTLHFQSPSSFDALRTLLYQTPDRSLGHPELRYTA